MTTQTLTLTDFLLARIAEDESAARNKASDHASHDGFYTWVGRGGAHGVGVTSQRVLAECEAKRKIVEWAAPVLTNWPNAPQGFRYVSEDGRNLIMTLAAVYAAHPDYREGWAL